MDAAETLSKVKKNVLKNTHLTDKDKQIVIHILKVTFKDIVTEEKKAEEAYLRDTSSGDSDDPIGGATFDSIFGEIFKEGKR